jgi:hypothetical protein
LYSRDERQALAAAEEYMMQSKLTWIFLLIVSTIVLVWRLLDFTYEALGEGFQMTRGGLMLKGFVAGVSELAIILVIVVLVLKSLSTLMRLHNTRPTT